MRTRTSSINMNLFNEIKNSFTVLCITNPKCLYLTTYEIQHLFQNHSLHCSDVAQRSIFSVDSMSKQIQIWSLNRFFQVKPGMAHGRVYISMRPNSLI